MKIKIKSLLIGIFEFDKKKNEFTAAEG